jgi:predicted ATPase
MGKFTTAGVHLEQGIALYNPQQHRNQALRSGQDAGVVCLGHAAWVLWALGYPDQALKRIQETLTLAQALSHPLSLTWAQCITAIVHHFRRESEEVQKRAQATTTLAREYGFAQLLAQGETWQGWKLVEKGKGEEGIAQMREGLAAHRATGADVYRPYFLALLTEAYERMGKTEEGMSTLNEALTVVERTGERFYEAELYRLRGELTLAQSSVQRLESSVQKEAEACFLKAIEVARKQQAKSWELRAVMSLSRLWQQQGKKKEAHDLLTEIYNWFTEGFDTKDLQEAKALLEELNH